MWQTLAVVTAVALASYSAPDVLPKDPAALLEARYGDELDSKFRHFELAEWSRDSVLDDARSGRVALSLIGGEYIAVVHEYELFPDGSVPQIEVEHGVSMPDPSYTFESAFFRGHLEGDEESTVLITITKVGVDGFVRTSTDWIQFNPLIGLFNDAPAQWTVIYRTADVIPRTGSDAHDEAPLVDNADSFPIGALSATSPSVRVNGDFQFFTAYSSCWYCKMDDVMARVTTIYSSGFSWTINVHSRATCSTSACDSSSGRTSTNVDTLLDDHAGVEANDRFLNSETWTQNALFSGKNLDGSSIGKGYKAGKYIVALMIDDDDYDGGSINYEAGILASHEFAHNFYMSHSDTHFTHWHSVTPFEHYYIESTYHRHEPSEWTETIESFQSSTRTTMNSCNDGTWLALGYGVGPSSCT